MKIIHGVATLTILAAAAATSAEAKNKNGHYGPQDDIKKAAQSPICSCTANCVARGDPHVVSFYDKDEKVLHETFDMYRVGNFAVVAHADASNRIGDVDIGSKSYSINDCKPGDVISQTEDLGTKGIVKVNLNCTKNKNIPGSHFNVDIFKTNDGNDFDFKKMEQKTGSVGQCVDKPTTRLRSLKGSMKDKFPTICYCSSYCAVFGDPEFVDFAGKKKKATIPRDGQLTIYAEGNFAVEATVQGKKERIYELAFGHSKYISSRDCSSRGQKINLSHTWKNGDTLDLVLTCFSIGEGHPFFFNTLLRKVDVPENDGAKTFEQMEAKRGSGLCVA